jgi:hypothetical protein
MSRQAVQYTYRSVEVLAVEDDRKVVVKTMTSKFFER